jgi:hypothetical protein
VVDVYLDDILIHTQTLAEHRKVIREVLKHLEKFDLYLRPEKCEFELQELEYLGLIIRPNEIAMDPGKVAAVAGWKQPKNLKQVQALLGFANFYRRFFPPSYAAETHPLTDLTQKNKPFVWGTAQQRAFEFIKNAVASVPVLAMYNSTRPTHIETNASNFATGAILSQKQNDGKWHLITYRSSIMSTEERNYKIYDHEMLGLIHALEDWQHFLEGLPEPFEVVTDHKNMEWWASMRDLTCCQARWALYLSRFHFVIKYKKGSQMQADALSQSTIGGKFLDAVDNRQVTVLKPEQFIAAATVHFKPDDDSLTECIHRSSAREAEVLEGLRALGKASPHALTEGVAAWEEEDGLVYFKGKLYIPNERALRSVTIPRVDCRYVFPFSFMFHHFLPASPAVPVHDPSGRHVI